MSQFELVKRRQINKQIIYRFLLLLVFMVILPQLLWTTSNCGHFVSAMYQPIFKAFQPTAYMMQFMAFLAICVWKGPFSVKELNLVPSANSNLRNYGASVLGVATLIFVSILSGFSLPSAEILDSLSIATEVDKVFHAVTFGLFIVVSEASLLRRFHPTLTLLAVFIFFNLPEVLNRLIGPMTLHESQLEFFSSMFYDWSEVFAQIGQNFIYLCISVFTMAVVERQTRPSGFPLLVTWFALQFLFTYIPCPEGRWFWIREVLLSIGVVCLYGFPDKWKPRAWLVDQE